MAAGGARRGRRDNGLDAAEYAVVADVDPRVGEHLLDVLAAGGIAAYLQPASDLNPVTRTTTVPARPTDRLYVDRQHLQTARDYLARLSGDEEATPAPRPPSGPAAAAASTTPDIDAEWARLVAGFHEEVDPAARTWPAAEQIDLPARDPTRDPTATGGDPTAASAGTAIADPAGPGAADPTVTGAADPTGTGVADPTGAPAGRPRSPEALRRPVAPRDPDPDEPSLLDGLDTFGADLPDEADDEEGYTPPPPPPLPRISKYAVAGILGVVGGFVLFLFPSLLPLDNGISMLLGFAGIIAGFVTLIWRLRPGDDDADADPDDGAVV